MYALMTKSAFETMLKKSPLPSVMKPYKRRTCVANRATSRNLNTLFAFDARGETAGAAVQHTPVVHQEEFASAHWHGLLVLFVDHTYGCAR